MGPKAIWSHYRGTGGKSSPVTMDPGAIQFYIVGLVCMHCICIVLRGILGELSKFWLTVVDYNVLKYF